MFASTKIPMETTHFIPNLIQNTLKLTLCDILATRLANRYEDSSPNERSITGAYHSPQDIHLHNSMLMLFIHN